MNDINRRYDAVLLKVLELLEKGGGHVGSVLSSLHIMVALHFDVMDSGDKFILSKGHAAPGLYGVLQEMGFYRDERLRRHGSPFQGHPDKRFLPECHASTGSLGQGVSIATGMAMAYKRLGRHGRIFVLAGDGECQEGQVWEAIAFAAHHRLNNLVVLVDENGLQHDGSTRRILDLGSLQLKFEAFGFSASEADGHDFCAIADALRMPSNRPRAVVFKTVKGYGFKEFENDPKWHSIKDMPRFLSVVESFRREHQVPV